MALGATLALASAPVLAQDETSASGYPADFNPTQLAVGPDGSLYASDCAAARVYRIGPDGVTVVIGSGPGGFGASFKGDGGPATEAETLCPYGIAFDPEGRLLLVDHGNNRVRRVDEAGVITTIAGSGPGQFNGGFEGDEGPATEGLMQEPTGIAIDSAANVYVSDRENDRVRRIGTDGVISTVAGNGEAPFSGDGGPATEASLDDPAGLAVDDEGYMYIADSNHSRIRRVGPDGGIETIAGTGEFGSDGDGGPATEAMLSDPESLLFDEAGDLYIGDPMDNRIRRVGPDGIITTFAGTGKAGYDGDGGPATEATFNLAGDPASLAIDASGNIYIGDSGNHVIRVVDPSGTISTLEVAASPDEPTASGYPTDCPAPLASGAIATVAGSGNAGDAGDGGPALEASLALMLGSVAVDVDGNLYVSSWNGPDIRRINTAGTIMTFAGPTTGAPFRAIAGLAFDDAGYLYVADHFAAMVWRVDPAGDITTVAGTGVRGASGDDGPAVDAQIQSDYIGVSPSGEVYLSDTHRYRTVTSDGVIHPFAGSGVFGFSGDGGPALEATFSTVDGIASDRAGNVYIVDEANQRIRRVDPDGIVTTVAGSGKRGYTGDGGPALAATLQDPVMIAVDEGDGSLYFADHHNHVVRRVSADGIISTVAGTGVQGFSGDCGPATEAMLDQPWGIAIHDGVLFIADMGNNRVRMVVP